MGHKLNMKIDYSDLEDAYMWVSGAPMECSAMIDRNTGKIYFLSDSYDVDDDCPEDIGDEEKYLSVPGQYDLDLGNSLAFRFARCQPRLDEDEIREIFHRKGAYSRFSNLLDKLNLQDEWHEFRSSAIKAALISWCEEHGIEVTG